MPRIRSRSQQLCMLCHCTGNLLYSGLSDRLFGVPGVWSYRQCVDNSCGLVWLDPKPLAEDLIHAYSDYYTHSPGNLPRGLAFSLFRSLFYAFDALVVRLARQSANKIALSSMYLDGRPRGRLLDVGAGSGVFLHRMKLRGWEVEGVDPDPVAAQTAQAKYGITVHACDLQEKHYPSAIFDAVTLNHVFEHLPDPVSFLTECERILKPGGRLVTVTPNIRSWAHFAFVRNWRGLEPPRHLYLFSPCSLAACANKAGLSQFAVTTNAANSWPIIYESLQLRGSGQIAASPFLLGFRALLYQYKECRTIEQNPDAGEVCVLVYDRQ